MAAIGSNITPWTRRRIPYVFENGYSLAGDVRNAMTEWELAAGVFFVERSNEDNYLLIKDGGSSKSYVGMAGGMQEVIINKNYKALHELGHALGLIHEQSRSDRDQYITVLWDNIQGGKTNWNYRLDETSNNLTPYDRFSTMQYPSPAQGWGALEGQNLQTMTWNADPSMRDIEGDGGATKGRLSDLDKDPAGLRAYYSRVSQAGWGPFPLQKPMGATTVDGDRPFVFVLGNDGNLWMYALTNGRWSWDIHGTPPTFPLIGIPGTTIAETCGAITVDNSKPTVFFKGGDGNLWSRLWDGDNWSWMFHGTPPNVAISESYGVIIVDGDRPFVFVKGGDGNLWSLSLTNGNWNWDIHGTPDAIPFIGIQGTTIAETYGAITVNNSKPVVFFKGGDGNLWSRSWDGDNWIWTFHSTPPNVAISESFGATTVDGDRPFVFVKGSDGNLWMYAFTNDRWSWDIHGTPDAMPVLGIQDTTIAEAYGAITIDNSKPAVFFKGGNGNLWSRLWDGDNWIWMVHGVATGAPAFTESYGTITVNGSDSYVFTKDVEGNLGRCCSNDNNWAWLN